MRSTIDVILFCLVHNWFLKHWETTYNSNKLLTKCYKNIERTMAFNRCFLIVWLKITHGKNVWKAFNSGISLLPAYFITLIRIPEPKQSQRSPAWNINFIRVSKLGATSANIRNKLSLRKIHYY